MSQEKPTKVITLSSSKKKRSDSANSLDIDFLNEVIAEPKIINDFIVTFKSQNYSNDKF